MAFLVFALLCSCCVVVSSNTVHNLTVARNGTDNLACLTGNTACLTLHYTINTIPRVYRGPDNITLHIEIQYSHLVERINTVILSNMNIEIFSEQPHISLCFYKNDYFEPLRTITGSHLFTSSYFGNYNVSLLFRGIKFHGCHDINSTEVAPVTMAFNVFMSLEFYRCSVEDGSSLEIVIGDVGHVKITNCVFQHSSFAAGSLSIQYVPFTKNEVDLLIRDNVFVNSTGIGVDYSSIFSIMGQALVFNIPFLYRDVMNVSVVIDNCTITKVSTRSNSPLIGIIVENGDRILNGNFVIRNINFNGLVSRGDFIDLDLSSSSSNQNNITLDISNCIFTQNNVLNSAALVSTYVVKSKTKMSISNTSILSNRGSCVQMYADDSPNLEFSIRNTLIQNNADRHLLNLRSLTDLESSVVLENVTVLENLAIEKSEETMPIGNFALLEVNQLNLRIVSSIFMSNTGTSLFLTNSNVSFAGINVFRNNVAVRGGAIACYNRASFLIEESSSVDFDDNLADYGGAVYIASNNSSSCVIDATNCSSASSITFNNNEGLIDGNNLFITEKKQAKCIGNYIATCLGNNILDSGLVGTLTLHMKFTTNVTEVFPGQNIKFGLTVLNVFNVTSTIEVRVSLHCNGEWYNCDKYGYELLGPHLTTFTSRALSPTDYILKAASENHSPGNLLEIFLLGDNLLRDRLTLALRPCPNGFAFSNQTGMCECLELNYKSEYYFCSRRLGIACVAQGVWLGKVAMDNGTTVAQECYSTVCNAESQPCPAQVDGVSTTFVLLGQNSDDQCSKNEGGVLCSGCGVNSNFTFEGWSCISSSNCELWHPYVLLVLSLISQLALCMLLLAMLRLKLGFGLGYLYGPVFYLAVVTQLPFRHHTEYSALRALISIVKSIFFLDLEWLGIIPMCTFDIGRLGNYAFRYIGPLITNLVIIITIMVARKCPKLLAFLQESPVQSICLLLYLSFWSLAETSLTIFYPIFLPTGNASMQVYLQPDTPYLTDMHIFLIIVAMLTLVLLVLPFTLFLTCSPFLAQKFNLIRIKPLMDEFQSCYKPRYQWYPAIYIIAWICLIFVSWSPPLFQSVVLVVMFTHIILQPYQNRWLNTIDTLLLLDALFVYSLLVQQIPDEKGLQIYKVFLAYLLVILPFLYIFLGIVFIVAQRTGFSGHVMRTIRQIKSRAAKKSKKASVTTTEVSVSELIKIDKASATTTSELIISFGSNGVELREPFLEEVTKF